VRWAGYVVGEVRNTFDILKKNSVRKAPLEGLDLEGKGVLEFIISRL
jgi:hypothetical protein